MTVELQKELAQRMGLLTGKPPSSGLHIFPLMHTTKQLADKEVTVISDQGGGGKPKDAHEEAAAANKPRLRLQDPSVTPVHRMWHTDSQFEHVPGDYAVLRMVELPRSGGDTVWASGYDVYDRLSRPMRAFLAGLTFTAGQKDKYEAIAAANGLAWYTEPRGAPENVGTEVTAVHPVIRTNPVTGWNTVYCLGHHVQRINGLSQIESRKIVDWLHEMVVLNHDIHVRHRWTNENDIAIWDNQCMVHTATPDYLGKGLGDRRGFRVLGIRDRPYLDPEAVGREEGLDREEAVRSA
ncbi:hypothetical protein diail_5334 [Diaporthe ilicicola]|nr:hypothetical protein diail_5334 [Diaporthe ilicicola]